MPIRKGRRTPKVLVADRAYDSNPLRRNLVRRHILPVIPARSNNHRATHQDGRHLRRYRHRWIIERTNSWLQFFRRLVVRYERKIENFLTFVHLACAMIVCRRIVG